MPDAVGYHRDRSVLHWCYLRGHAKPEPTSRPVNVLKELAALALQTLQATDTGAGGIYRLNASRLNGRQIGLATLELQ